MRMGWWWRRGFIDPHHALRRADLLDGADAVVVARRDLCGNGQLRRGDCAVRPGAARIAMRDLVNVEAIPFEVLNAGIHVGLGDVPQYMEAAARRKPALNLAFLAPLTPFSIT